MSSSSLPSPRELTQRLTTLEARVRAAAAGLHTEQMRQRPASGGWSIEEVLGHLITTTDGYTDGARDAVKRAGAKAGNPANWKPGLAGRLILRSITSRMRLPAPKAFRPGAQPRTRAVEDYLRSLREVRSLMDETTGLDWNAIRFSSPVSSLFRIRLGESFAISVLHGERHMAQLERVRAEVLGPAARQPG
jgi:hypothetical protein